MDLTHLSRHPCESRGPAFLGKIGQLRRRRHFFTASKAGTYFVPHERWREARPKQITTVSLIKCTVTGTPPERHCHRNACHRFNRPELLPRMQTKDGSNACIVTVDVAVVIPSLNPSCILSLNRDDDLSFIPA